MTRAAPETLVRFTASERVFHWAQAAPYFVLLITGALLLLEHNRVIDWFDVDRLVQVHLFSGAALPILVFLAFLGGDRRTLLRNLRIASTWTRADFRWLWSLPLSVLSRRIRPPPAGKFNAGQKLNVMAQVVLIPAFVVTGFVMWRDGEALLPWALHVAAFVVAVPLVSGHLYLALIHPSTRRGLSAVFTGRVDADWARHHYPLEYGLPPVSAPPRPRVAEPQVDRAHAADGAKDDGWDAP